MLTTAIAIFSELPREEVEKVAVEADREGHVGRGHGPLLSHALVQGNRRPDQAAVEKCCEMV